MEKYKLDFEPRFAITRQKFDDDKPEEEQCWFEIDKESWIPVNNLCDDWDSWVEFRNNFLTDEIKGNYQQVRYATHWLKLHKGKFFTKEEVCGVKFPSSKKGWPYSKHIKDLIKQLDN